MDNLSNKIYKKAKRPIRILQFGEGNFLRAFVDWMIQEANDREVINTNICVVQPLEFGRVNELNSQNGLYTLYLEGVKNNEVIRKNRVRKLKKGLYKCHECGYDEMHNLEELKATGQPITERDIYPTEKYCRRCLQGWEGKKGKLVMMKRLTT